MLSPDSLLEAYLHVWQELLRHDEIVLALYYLDNVPWRIRHRAEIIQARRITLLASAHIDNEGAYARWYVEHATREWTIPPTEDVDEKSSQAGRWRFVADIVDGWRWGSGVKFDGSDDFSDKKILDLGCQDGWMSVRLADKFEAFATGVDLSPSLVELAREAAEARGVSDRCTFIQESVPPTQPIPGGPWDLVLCCELWEHVRDAEALHRYLLEVVTPGSHLILTTPHGSWHGGCRVHVPIAPPWYVDREHVRVATLADLVERFSMDFEIEKAEIVRVAVPEVQDQAEACILARRR
jgi:2-polyprenyl-3-methyl-5-hydroxy-6-metoxy-1,4-benzoquinol methylase